MRIGYYVQGDADEAVVRGLARRWCPEAALAVGQFRGRSRESFRREIKASLSDLRDAKDCDFMVMLTDADGSQWRTVKAREWARVPAKFKHVTVFGVADRNIESWLAANRVELSEALGCAVEEIPTVNPSNFVKRHFGLTDRDRREAAKERIRRYVAQAALRSWIESSESFREFYSDVRRVALRSQCEFPNELDRDG